MDPLSVVASIAGLVGLADVVVRRLVNFASAAKQAKDDISALLLRTSSLLGVLQSLKLLAEQYSGQEVSYVQTHHLHSCYQTLEQFRSMLCEAFPSKHETRFAVLKMKLHWPITKSIANKLIKELEEHQSTLSLALCADSLLRY